MAKQTARDRCWNRALDIVLKKGGVVRKQDLILAEEVSERTAADVLSTMTDMGWLKREYVPGPKADNWRRGDELPATLSTEGAK
ncbi:ORF13 [Halorubrum pleomorphic virus 10]|uniref:ORF13 n=1 Tax=Halorubrum pleomorphic virus 10 TaxID=2507576 RepID=A0A410N6S8_9VIRU|nr:ORF13 [Halorubrum pleomorphic virus 10]QAS68830.1 ORF13 [Halorubrum pleomorphic virus 10]